MSPSKSSPEQLSLEVELLLLNLVMKDLLFKAFGDLSGIYVLLEVYVAFISISYFLSEGY